MRKQIAGLAATAAVLMAVSGCGGESGPTAAEVAAAKDRAAAEEAEREVAEEEKQEEQARAEATERQAACRRLTKGLLSSLEELNSRLNIGLNYSEYSDRVGDVQVAYDRIPFKDMSAPCIRRVGVPLENAFNAYIRVFRVWGTCIDDVNCDFNEGEPNRKAQDGWGKAGNLVDKAQAGLERLGQVS